jgi:hypothetical protein
VERHFAATAAALVSAQLDGSELFSVFVNDVVYLLALGAGEFDDVGLGHGDCIVV